MRIKCRMTTEMQARLRDGRYVGIFKMDGQTNQHQTAKVQTSNNMKTRDPESAWDVLIAKGPCCKQNAYLLTVHRQIAYLPSYRTPYVSIVPNERPLQGGADK